MNLILIAVISLGAIALVLAAILYVASKKFAVYEDPRIAQVGEVLPQANCGGCGYPGCSGFADACVKAGSLDGKFCPVGGQPVMAQIADILGLAAGEAEPMVAVVRCNGTCMNRPRINSTTVRRVALLPLRSMVGKRVVVTDVWGVVTVWLPASSMPST